MTTPAPVGYHTPFSRTPYFFNVSFVLKKAFEHESLYSKIGLVAGAVAIVVGAVAVSRFFYLHIFFSLAVLIFDAACTGTNFFYRWSFRPILQGNTKALTENISQDPAQIVLQFLDPSERDNFHLDAQTLGIAELKGRIEQTGEITAQQFERLEFLNTQCDLGHKVGIDTNKVTRVSLSDSDTTNEQFGSLLKQFPRIDQWSVEFGCTKLTQKGVQKAIEDAPRSWKNLQIMSSFHGVNQVDLLFGHEVNITPDFLKALSSQVSSLEELSIRRWFPHKDSFDRLLQNCRQLKSFSAKGMIDGEEPNSPSITALGSCLSLEKLRIFRFGNQQEALPRIFENCPLKHVSLYETPLGAGSLQLLAQSRKNDLHTLEIYELNLTQNDLQVLGRHCHGFQHLLIPYDARIPNLVYEELVANNRQLEAFAFCDDHTHRDDPTIPNYEALAKARPNLKYFYSVAGSPTAAEDMRTMIRLCPELKSIWIQIAFVEMSRDEWDNQTKQCRKQLKSEFPHISFSRFYMDDWKPKI